MTNLVPDIYGNEPAYIQWKIVRGDTAVLKIEFLENDEETTFDTSDWEFLASAYDPKADTTDELEVVVNEGYIEIIASSDITSFWGTGYQETVAELPFDLEVTLDDDTVWTPVVGTIKVSRDITNGSL
jgi:hypothetical protein